MPHRLDSILARRGFEALFDENPDPVYVLTLDGTFMRGNTRVLDVTGYEPSELRAMRFTDLVHPEDQDRVAAEFKRSIAGGNSRYRTRCIQKTGGTVLLDVTAIPLRDDDGTVAGVIAIGWDVSELDEKERQSEQNEAILRMAGRLAKFGGWSIEVATGELYTSEELNRILGIQGSGSLHYRDGLASHPEPDRSLVQSAMERCMSTGDPIDVTCAILDAVGSRLDVRIVGEAVRDDSGAIVRIQGAFYDISEVIAKERAAAELEAKLTSTLNQMTTGIAFLDREWRFTFVNETAQRYLRNSAETMLGATMWELYPERENSKFDAAYRLAMNERVVGSGREYYPPFDTWFEVTAYPTDDGIAIHIDDVTEDQRARMELEASHERLRYQATLLDTVRDAIVVRDLDHTITYWNRGAEKMYGWSAEEAVGRSARELLYHDPEAFDQAQVELLHDGYWDKEIDQFARDGRPIIADCRWLLLLDEAGEPQSVLIVNTDITEWMLEQQRANRAQRMESLGTLAGGIAHDLNNVLTPIMMGVQLLASDERDENRRAMLESIETGVKRGAEMIKQVLSFARGEEGERRETEIGELFTELTGYCRTTLPKSIRVKTELPPRLPTVLADSTQIMQVLMNLVTNASHAMPRGGKLVIRAREVEQISTADSSQPAGRGVVIEVEDTGVGMTSATSVKVFEPFFTTKEQGKGTGLGLSTSMAIARSHGGTMEVYSEPGRGSRFQLHLPVADACREKVKASPPVPPASNTGGRGEVILVIDDEANIRQLARQALEAGGYRTLEASDGMKAIELVEKRGSRVDLVLTDMMMPGVGGATTAAYLREHHPHVALVAASGLSGNEDIARTAHPGLTYFLPKPFAAAELLTAVRHTLDTWEPARDR